MSRLIDADELLYVLSTSSFPQDVDTGKAYYIFKKELRNAPTVDAVPVSTLEQIKWERDSFAEQIREIGGEPFAKWDSMDVVKVVRCKDCKHWLKTTVTYVEGDPVYTCPKLTMDWGDEDGYCFMGERR